MTINDNGEGIVTGRKFTRQKAVTPRDSNDADSQTARISNARAAEVNTDQLLHPMQQVIPIVRLVIIILISKVHGGLDQMPA